MQNAKLLSQKRGGSRSLMNGCRLSFEIFNLTLCSGAVGLFQRTDAVVRFFNVCVLPLDD